jgi:aspartate racemase
MGTWPRVIGIVGGLGPYAHVELERRLLAAVADPASDQDYPEWVVSSIPGTPDRTAALLGRGPSPVPALVESLARLAGRADFAVIACITAHAFLDEVRREVRLPILDLVAATLTEAIATGGERGRIGLLATTGTLESGLFRDAARRVAPGLELLSLLDLSGGRTLQEELVMRPIYGPLEGERRLAGGIKSGGEGDPRTGAPHRQSLARAVEALAGAGAAAVITGCTEIALILGTDPVAGLPLLDPLAIAARNAIGIARGELPLPE